eukprot:557926-Pleurochrysis_carterae.AAC.2
MVRVWVRVERMVWVWVWEKVGLTDGLRARIVVKAAGLASGQTRHRVVGSFSRSTPRVRRWHLMTVSCRSSRDERRSAGAPSRCSDVRLTRPPRSECPALVALG